MSSKIKVPKFSKEKSHIVDPNHREREVDKIIFSFEPLTYNKYFNLDMTCANWSSELFNVLKEVSCIPKKEIFSGKHKKFRIHNHEKARPPIELPTGINLKDCHQIRLSKSKGGIHGIFRENIFYVIWLDPLHNMYPDEKYGGLKEVKEPGNCCQTIWENKVKELNEKLEQVEKEKKEYEDLLEGLT